MQPLSRSQHFACKNINSVAMGVPFTSTTLWPVAQLRLLLTSKPAKRLSSGLPRHLARIRNFVPGTSPLAVRHVWNGLVLTPSLSNGLRALNG